MNYSNLPVKVLQFGEGNFLRAFADYILDRSIENGDFDGSVAVIKPRGDKPLSTFATQNNRYTVAVRGADENGTVEENRTVTCLHCAINPNLEPERYEALCLGEQLRFVISNTTEAGIHFDETDSMDGIPFTFPGRVTKLLYQRYRHFGGDRSKGLYLLPCELIDHNGEALKACVLRYSALWKLESGFTAWLDTACHFCDTLVDRIVSGFPKEPAPFFAALGHEDKLLTVCEPFYLWVIQEKGELKSELPIHKANSGVLFTADITPYQERKVRLLNGAHTALTPLALLCGKECVDEVMRDPHLLPFLEGLYEEEIIPAFAGLPKAELEAFAEAVKSRFRNPFLHHRWEAISLNSWSKFVARLMPTVRDSKAVPQRIALAMAALIHLYQTRQMNDDPKILEFFRTAEPQYTSEFVESLLDDPIFGLSELKGTQFAHNVIKWLVQLKAFGAERCIRAFRNVIRIHPKDNVAVATDTLLPISPLCVDGQLTGVNTDTIPVGHKIALERIEEGETVYKYGCPIGIATKPIGIGDHVHSHNLRSALTGSEVFTYSGGYSAECTAAAPTFRGFRRKNGKVGIRNEIWIIPTVGCVGGTAEKLAQLANAQKPAHIDAVVALTHPYGCSQLGDDHAATRQLLANLAAHPNAAGVLLLGLGCENNQLADLLPLVQQPNLRTLVCQEANDELAEGLTHVLQLMEHAETARTEVSAAELVIGIKCGGSDAFSGITANPLVGKLSDTLCGFGGSVVMGEVPEMFGAETALLARCENEAVFTAALAMVNEFKDYYLSKNLPICENPSPGNRAGGITTLEEKSLGCTQKSGLSPVTDVLPYGGVHRKKGVTLLSTPGNDLVASTALAAAGCHMVLFTTGRGTPFGTCVPTVKLSTNSALAQKKPGWIDFDAGTLLGGDSMDALSQKLLQFVLQVAEGAGTKNELLNDRQIAIFKNGVTL